MNKKNALLSVYDKTAIVEFGQSLVALGWTIYSSGGTARRLNENGVPSIDVAKLVGGEAILGHKVVTLSREINAGLLANPLLDMEIQELENLGIPFIGLVCVDCYPLAEEIAKPEATRASVIEQTDIGGPTMLRSSAKGRRPTICDVADRERVIDWLEAGKPDEDAFITELAAKAETYVGNYSLQSGMYHGQGTYFGRIGRKIHDLRYGENPWQKSHGLFENFNNDDPLAISNFEVEEGKHGHINWTDVDRLLQTITHVAAGLEKNGCLDQTPFIAVGVKHGNACGAAIADSAEKALKMMLDGNLLSIFGGAVMTNFPIYAEEATILRSYNVEKGRRLLDVVVSPNIDADAKEILHRKGQACKLATNLHLSFLSEKSLDTQPIMRNIRGGFLVQDNYTFVLDLKDINLSDAAKIDVILAWGVGSTSTSNTITLVKNGMLIGNGVGQMDRVGAANLAIERALEMDHEIDNAVAFSDSFFPFTDGPELLADVGVNILLAASGSVNDKKVREFCESTDMQLITFPNAEMRGFYGH